MTNPSRPLRAQLSAKPLLKVMAAHNALSAKLAEEAGYDGIWGSGFELSAAHALPDVSLLSMTQHLDTMRSIAETVSIPIVADVDTGFGNAVNVDYVMRRYEEAGVAAVVIEDKTFPKVTSLVAGGRQELLPVVEFQGKIKAAVAARSDPNFVIIARTEALIAGLGREEALRRAHAYEEAGANLILVHSKSKTPDEIVDFVRAWDGRTRLVLVPTAYPQLTLREIEALEKVAIVIFGNHAIRAAITAMQATFKKILADGGIHEADHEIVSVEEVFRLQDMARVKTLEERFLR